MIVVPLGLVLRQRQDHLLQSVSEMGNVHEIPSSSYLQEDNVLLLSLRLRDEHLGRWALNGATG